MKYIIALIFCVISLESKEVFYLPTETKGSIPQKLYRYPFLGMELGLASAHYLESQFLVTVTPGNEVAQFLESNPDFKSTKSNPSTYKTICELTESSFLAKDFIIFETDSATVGTDIYNCNLAKLERSQTSLGKAWLQNLREHVKKSFPYFPKRTEPKNPDLQSSETTVINLIIDANGASSPEKEEIKKFIRSLEFADQTQLNLYVASDEKIFKLVNEQNKNKWKDFVENIPFRKNNSQEVFVAIFKMIAKTKFFPASNSVKNIFFLNSKLEKNASLSNELLQHHQLRYTTNVIVGSSMDLQDTRVVETVARAGKAEVQFLKYATRLDFPNRSDNLVLHKNELYVSNENDADVANVTNPGEINLKGSSKKVNSSEIFARTDSLNSFNFVKVYESILNMKPLNSPQVKSNMQQLLEQSVVSRDTQVVENKILLRTNNGASWVYYPQTTRVTEANDVLLSTAWTKLKNSSTGYKNDPGKTRFLRPTTRVSELLVFTTEELNQYFTNPEAKYLLGFIRGKKEQIDP